MPWWVWAAWRLQDVRMRVRVREGWRAAGEAGGGALL